MAAVSCRAMLVLRCYDVTRVISVTSAIAAPRKYRNETWCRRWWHISHKSLSTSASSFAPSLSPILSKHTRDHLREAKEHKFTRNIKDDESTVTDDAPLAQSAIQVSYNRGLPRIMVPLPSRRESCMFTLKPISHTVGDFLEMLKIEDRGIDRAAITTIEGTRVSSCSTIETLMELPNFKLIINDVEYTVTSPMHAKYTMEDVQKLSDVKTLIAELYETLNVAEYNATLEREVLAELEQVRLELEPLEQKLIELEETAARRANMFIWACLVMMSMQFGGLARLTWWEYSWDIMEPVTYFVTYGTTMAWFIYFLVTKQEYMLPDVLSRQHLIGLHRRARKAGLDLNLYNSLKDRAYELECTLKVIRGPLYDQKMQIEQKRRLRSRSSSSSSSSRSPSSSPSPSPERTVPRKKSPEREMDRHQKTSKTD